MPWQWGLKHYWDAQLDADLESDALGWQYVSGCLAGAHRRRAGRACIGFTGCALAVGPQALLGCAAGRRPPVRRWQYVSSCLAGARRRRVGDAMRRVICSCLACCWTGLRLCSDKCLLMCKGERG